MTKSSGKKRTPVPKSLEKLIKTSGRKSLSRTPGLQTILETSPGVVKSGRSPGRPKTPNKTPPTSARKSTPGKTPKSGKKTTPRPSKRKVSPTVSSAERAAKRLKVSEPKRPGKSSDFCYSGQ